MSTILATAKQLGGTVSLGARVERPIEHCELTPTAFVQIKGGTLDNPTKLRLLDPSNFYYTYTWSRSPEKSSCCNPTCLRGDSFEPIRWSKAVLGGPELMCNVCFSAGHPPHGATFCSKG